MQNDINTESDYTAALANGDTCCHACNSVMVRGIRLRTVAYKDRSENVQMPGWYCQCGEAIFSGTDMAVSGLALRRLKSEAEEGSKN